MPPQNTSVYRFGVFELDLRAVELRKSGMKLRLQDQPYQVLLKLLEHPGEIVTREELRSTLWHGDTFVDFETGLNTAVKRLRETLGDSADSPTFIETLPRRGYKFIAPVESPVSKEIVSKPATGPAKVWADTRIRWIKISASILVGVVCAIAVLFSYRIVWPRVDPPPMTPVPFTDYPGFEYCPAFSPDGSQIAFSWSGDPAEKYGADLYVKAIHSENLLRLTHHPSGIICANWSPDGTQLAFYRHSAARVNGVAVDSNDDTGIYIVPALGGPERKLRSTQGGFGGVTWSVDGKWLAYPDQTSPVAVTQPTDPARIFVLSLDTLESHQIPHADECLAEMFPAFSHSSDRLAYVCLLKKNDNEFGIYSMSLSRGSPKLVAKFTAGWGLARRYSVDGRRQEADRLASPSWSRSRAG